jgi:hypothetical protein
MSAVYYVDTIHLNVGVGDCSIVCKLQHVAGATAKPILISAVLIDGGYASAAAVIKQCLTVQLPNRYDVETVMKGKVILTAVVITHWDADHYGGVMNLIRTDLIEQIDLIEQSKGKKLKLKEINDLRCSFFNQPSLFPNIVYTTLYVPYWEVEGVNKSTPMDRLQKNDKSEPWPGSGDTLNFKLLKTESGYNNSWVMGLCRLRSSSTQNLGKNLFNGLGPPLNKDLTSPLKLATELMKTNAPLSPNQPALLANEPALVCVGCNLDGVWKTPKMSLSIRNVGEKGKLTRVSPSSAQKLNLQVTEDHPPDKSVKIVNINTGHSASQNTNAASISCVILWANKSGHVSHYLAGDLYWDWETPLINWISLTKEPIGAMKLSHHGSESSSPAAVFLSLNPMTVIASAGTSHGHPRKAPPKLMEIG